MINDANAYISRLKENIIKLIENNRLEMAKELLNQYEKIVSNDIDIYSIKSVIAMMSGDIKEAEKVLIEGLSLDEENFDILYNLAYLYQVCAKKELCLEYCKRALQCTKNKEEASEVLKILYDMEIPITELADLKDYSYGKYYYNAVKLDSVGNKSDAALNYGLAYRYTEDEVLKSKLREMYKENTVLRTIFDVAAKNKSKRFIILSSCDWSYIYQRMHHIARSLVKFGHEVIYITPGTAINVDSASITIDFLIEKSFDNMKKVDGVRIYSPISAIYNQKQIANNYINLVQTLLNLQTENEETVIITYLPYQVQVIKSLEGEFYHIYECVDDHSDLDYAFWGTRKDILWEQELMDSADAITTTSTSLFLQRKSVENRDNVYLSKNAVNESDFIFTHNEMPDDLKNVPEPRIVYTGVVYERFDEKLFYEIVDSNPDKSFVIIGPINEGMLVEKRRNLYLLGPKRHSELKNYLRYMQVGIVPYIDSADMDIACDSIKQYEYLACGIPVITTFMPESGINKIYTFLANTKDSFNKALEKCLNLEIDSNIIKEFIAENSWNARAALICRLADGNICKLEQKESIKTIGSALKKINDNYNWPIFTAIYALYSNLEDSNKFENLAKQAYNAGKYKYVERTYLDALYKNKKRNEFIKVVSQSQYIQKELKQELVLSQQRKDFRAVDIISCICIGDIKQALNLIEKLPNEKRVKYLIYIKYLLGEEIASRDLALIRTSDRESPLIKKIREKISSNVDYLENRNNIYLADIFNNVSEKFINTIIENGIKIEGLCTLEEGLKNGIKMITVRDVVRRQKLSRVKIIVPYDNNYIKQVRTLAEQGVDECEIAILVNSKLHLISIDKTLMRDIKKKEYNRTVTFNRFNAADSNIDALLKFMPDEYKHKYKVNVIKGEDVWSIENIVKVPLHSLVTVSGFATFLYHYPKFTYNIDVGHGGVSLKACGIMDKKDKKSGGYPEIFEKADIICVASHLHMIVYSSFYGIPEDKYRITGLPRNDMLKLSSSRSNLEKLLGISLNNKKIIFNMPTFHRFDATNRIEGSSLLNDSVKIMNFDYDRFNRFLEDNNLICISKVHHGEEISITAKVKNRQYSNILFINNDDLDEKDLSLYEILGAGDILITDYSTIYNDFLFMNKPIIFVTTDIDEYRKERGLALEPYDFWTAGPKVETQKGLEEEILKYMANPNYYKEHREKLIPVFFKDYDANSVKRTWCVIDESFGKLLKNKG